MSANALEWLVVLVFLVLFAAAIVGEIIWLVTKKWATAGRAAALVVVSNILSMILGSFLIGSIMLILFMLVMGPQGRGSDTPESVYWIGIILAFILPPILLIVIKRIMLGLLKIRSGGSAWGYSAVSSILAFLITLVPTAVLIYAISRK
ncbi:MAG: hypothetical protein QM785_04345 [Pyrinomonadaceae bacterium]